MKTVSLLSTHLQNIEVRVGDHDQSSVNGSQLTSNTICGNSGPSHKSFIVWDFTKVLKMHFNLAIQHMECPMPLYGRYITLQKLEPQTERSLCVRVFSAFILSPMNVHPYQASIYWSWVKNNGRRIKLFNILCTSHVPNLLWYVLERRVEYSYILL